MKRRYREPLTNPSGAAGFDKNLMSAATGLATFGGPAIEEVFARAADDPRLVAADRVVFAELAVCIRHVFTLNQLAPPGWRPDTNPLD